MAVTSLVIPIGVTVVSAEQGGTQLPASGGSIINFSSSTVYVTALQSDVGNMNNAAPLTQGSALPWPSGVTCYAWVSVGTGQVYITSVATQAYPFPQTVTVGGVSTDVGCWAIYQAVGLLSPGANLRYRLWSIFPNPQGNADSFYISFTPAIGGGFGNYFAFGGLANASYIASPITFPFGLPLETNTGMVYNDVAGASFCTIVASIEAG